MTTSLGSETKSQPIVSRQLLQAPGVRGTQSNSLETNSQAQEMRKIKNILHRGAVKDIGVESTDTHATLMQDQITWKSHT